MSCSLVKKRPSPQQGLMTAEQWGSSHLPGHHRKLVLCLAAAILLTVGWNVCSTSRLTLRLHTYGPLRKHLKHLYSSPRIFNLSTTPGQVLNGVDKDIDVIYNILNHVAVYPVAPGSVVATERELRYSSLSEPRSNRTVLLALNVINSENILPNFIHQLEKLLRFLGPHRVHVSIYENGSTDSTPQLLRIMAWMLESVGTSYTIVAQGLEVAKANKKDTNARIPVLADFRNAALAPLFDKNVVTSMPGGKFDTVLFMNDIFWQKEDALEVLFQQEMQKADMACSTDWGEDQMIYDRWVLRSMSGLPFYISEHIGYYYFRARWRWVQRPPSPEYLVLEPTTRERFEQNLPIQVFSCWNGMVAMNPAMFLPPYNIRFRSSAADETDPGNDTRGRESECFLISVDMWKAGFTKILTTKLASVAYDLNVYNEYRQDDDLSNTHHSSHEMINWTNVPPSQIQYESWMDWRNERWGPWDEA